MASALKYLDNDATQQTRLLIRMINKFFNCLNAKGPLVAKLKRKQDIAPYARACDERFKVRTEFNLLLFTIIMILFWLQWLSGDFLCYLTEWETEVASVPGLKQGERQKLTLSRETMDDYWYV